MSAPAVMTKYWSTGRVGRFDGRLFGSITVTDEDPITVTHDAASPTVHSFSAAPFRESSQAARFALRTYRRSVRSSECDGEDGVLELVSSAAARNGHASSSMHPTQAG